MSSNYDAIIVGARCAGAPTAKLLAERGYQVLVVDRAFFPSDTLSTLVIHATGVAALRSWGLIDEVVATGHLMREDHLEVGDHLEINCQPGIVRTIEPLLGEHELRLVVQLVRDRI